MPLGLNVHHVLRDLDAYAAKAESLLQPGALTWLGIQSPSDDERLRLLAVEIGHIQATLALARDFLDSQVMAAAEAAVGDGDESSDAS